MPIKLEILVGSQIPTFRKNDKSIRERTYIKVQQLKNK